MIRVDGPLASPRGQHCPHRKTHQLTTICSFLKNGFLLSGDGSKGRSKCFACLSPGFTWGLKSIRSSLQVPPDRLRIQNAFFSFISWLIRHEFSPFTVHFPLAGLFLQSRHHSHISVALVSSSTLSFDQMFYAKYAFLWHLPADPGSFAQSSSPPSSASFSYSPSAPPSTPQVFQESRDRHRLGEGLRIDAFPGTCRNWKTTFFSSMSATELTLFIPWDATFS